MLPHHHPIPHQLTTGCLIINWFPIFLPLHHPNQSLPALIPTGWTPSFPTRPPRPTPCDPPVRCSPATRIAGGSQPFWADGEGRVAIVKAETAICRRRRRLRGDKKGKEIGNFALRKWTELPRRGGWRRRRCGGCRFAVVVDGTTRAGRWIGEP